MFVRALLYKRREENQLDATECFIALIICSTCFGHFSGLVYYSGRGGAGNELTTRKLRIHKE